MSAALGAQASLPACFDQSFIAGTKQARMPALPGNFREERFKWKLLLARRG